MAEVIKLRTDTSLEARKRAAGGELVTEIPSPQFVYLCGGCGKEIIGRTNRLDSGVAFMCTEQGCGAISVVP